MMAAPVLPWRRGRWGLPCNEARNYERDEGAEDARLDVGAARAFVGSVRRRLAEGSAALGGHR